MSNLKFKDEKNPINSLFKNCNKLSKIKISGNIKEEVAKGEMKNPFKGIPESGELITNKKVMCNIPLDGNLPQNWDRNKK